MIVTVFVRPDVRERAIALAEELGLLKNSITAGAGSVAGFIGEIVVAEHTGARIEHTYDYDLILRTSRIDVKTKRTAVVPRPYHECSVADFNTKQDCDLYAFTRVRNDFEIAWILGCMPKDIFYRDARVLHTGMVDGSNGFVVKADCYNMPVGDLPPLPEKEKP